MDGYKLQDEVPENTADDEKTNPWTFLLIVAGIVGAWIYLGSKR